MKNGREGSEQQRQLKEGEQEGERKEQGSLDEEVTKE